MAYNTEGECLTGPESLLQLETWAKERPQWEGHKEVVKPWPPHWKEHSVRS